ncbi:hypothetical protein TL16_g01174 [Triparma laevis f. inornata]|uniref:J domain-containing protein n=1 Tax=Triparma laevis f. inornata TaxID=1714386 RepID=A0A9W6ZKZ7_9STRA|nr:hypothetical protein TL16_g01174 [Triparma laevis f. inornata]
MSALVPTSHLICPICSSHLLDPRALRNHLQSSRHSITNKTQLDDFIETSRNRENKRLYDGDLAKESKEVEAIVVEYVVEGKSVGVCFGENSNSEMIVTKIPKGSELQPLSSQLKGSKILSMNDFPCSTRSELQLAFSEIGSTRPIRLKFLTTPNHTTGFRTIRGRRRLDEEEDAENNDEQISNDNLSKEENFYHILNVQKTVSVREIQASYKKLAVSLHPDKGGNEEEFQSLNRAFKVLSNPKTRSRYDKHNQRLHPFIEAAKNDDLIALQKFDPDQFTSHNPGTPTTQAQTKPQLKKLSQPLTNPLASSITDRHGSNALHYASGSGASPPS